MPKFGAYWTSAIIAIAMDTAVRISLVKFRLVLWFNVDMAIASVAI